MRKTLLSICTAVFALLALSSCGKIWDEFGTVKSELDKINDRITALEEKLNSEVATINSAISAINATLKTVDADITALEALCTQLGVKDAELEKAFKDAAAALEAAYKKADADLKDQLESGYQKGDADIKAIIDELTNQVTDALAALNETDATLAEQANILVAEILKSMADLEAKIAITDITTNEKGEIVLTLKDGSKLTVSNVENSGLVTIVKDPETEESYWGLVQKDGKVESLGIPVGTDVEFDVTDDYELVLILNGEEIRTGAYVNEGDSTIITSVEEYETYAIITIGDANYYLPKYVESTFVIKVGLTYFEAGETKEFKLAIEEVADFYVMTKPDGWKAKVVEGKLVVTAPVAENVYAEEEGEILLHGCGVDGRCKIAKLAVTVKETGFTFEVVYGATFDYEEWGEVTHYENVDAVRIVNSQVVTYTRPNGETETGFANFYFGLAPIEAFEANPSEYLTNQIVNYGMDISFMWNNMYGDTYVAEEYEDFDGTIVPACTVSDKTVAISKIYSDITYGDEMPEGSHWVIWACPQDEKGTPIVSEVSYAYYEPVYINIQAVEATHNDIKLNITQVGADYFQVGKFVNNPDSRDYMNLEEQMYYFQEYGGEMGMVDETKGTYEIWLSEFAEYIEEGVEVDKLLPGSEYLVYVFPFENGKAASEYVYETDFAPYIFTFSTAPLTADGTTEVTGVLNETRTTINQIAVDLTATEGTETVYWNFYTQAEIDEFETEADILASVLADGTPSTDDVMTVQTPNSYPSIQPEEVRILVAVAVDAEGRYKSLYQEEFAADSIPYSADITVAVESVEFTSDDLKNVTVVYNVTGADYLVLKASSSKPSLQYNTTQGASMVNNLLLNGADYYQFSTVEVVDGKATVNFTNYSTSGFYKYVYSYVIACNLNEDKDVESLAEVLISDLSEYESEAEETPAE